MISCYFLISALNFDGGPLKIRLNCGMHWAQVRAGPKDDRNRNLKGFRPSRRTLQVIFQTQIFARDMN